MQNRNFGKTLRLFGVSLFIFFNVASLWAADEPPADRCQGYGDLQSISLADWESGLGAWAAGTHDVSNPATFDTPDWTSVGNLPDNRAGMAAFIPDLDIGDCGADDEAGALTLDSPSIAIPGDMEVPRISFDHWFDTELEYDGGNLKISVNGGAFNFIPASAFEYGEHYVTLAPALDDIGLEDNTNPLAGEEAFTGQSNGWEGVWINLLGIAGPGDTIRLRFDYGVDGCDGAVGWYVDDVEVYGCAAEYPPSDCGNGRLDAGEQCDDGNDFIDDGCSSTCQVESGWQCSDPGAPGNISDPGFEAGTPNLFWDEVSNNPIGTPICEVAVCGRAGGTGPFEGDFWVNLGSIRDYQEGSVSQSVVIPASVSTLTFELEIPTCDSSADYVEVLIDNQRKLFINGSNPRCGVVGYATQTADVSAYADGEAHEIEFHSETFSNNGGVSSFFIDEIALPGKPSMCTPAEPSLTLVKKVVNDDGGTAVPADWTLAANGPSSFSGPGPQVSSGPGFLPGTYDLSESGGPAGYQAGGWVCEGGTQNSAITVTLGQGESAVCTITNDDVRSGFQINAGHSGAWFNPVTSGQGLLFDVEPASKYMFIAWFTYTDAASDNPFEQRWLTAQGNYSGNSAVLELFETLGGKFDDPQMVTTTKIGEVTVTFSDCSHGQASYTIEGENLQGTIPLERVIPGSENTCEQLDGSSTQAVDINAGMDGAWFDPATSGQGYLVDSYPKSDGSNFMFVAWFTFGEDTASGQHWFTAQGGFSGSLAELEVFETTGGSFDDPQAPATVKVGTMRIDFIDCSIAALTYILTDDGVVEGGVAIQRVLPGAEALCKDIAGTD
jgi:cysteine-rich repeat protein